MDFVLDPPHVGRIVLGEPMDQAAQALRELGELRSVPTTPSWFVVRPSGLFIRVYPNAGDRVEAIEFGSGGPATDKVLYRDISLFDEPVDEVLRRLRQTTEVVESEDEPGYSFTAPALLLALWRPTLPEGPEDSDGRYFEAVLMASPGYYHA